MLQRPWVELSSSSEEDQDGDYLRFFKRRITSPNEDEEESHEHNDNRSGNATPVLPSVQDNRADDDDKEEEAPPMQDDDDKEEEAPPMQDEDNDDEVPPSSEDETHIQHNGGEDEEDHEEVEDEEVSPSSGEEAMGQDDEEIEAEGPVNVENYSTVLTKFAEKWLLTQQTHNVSATATEKFWDIALKFLPELVEHKARDSITKKTPAFTQERKKLYKNLCPEVKMFFGFKHKSTGVIETVECTSTPNMTFQRNPEYIKVFEEAQIQVIRNLVHKGLILLYYASP